jgi:hypothetical protein
VGVVSPYIARVLVWFSRLQVLYEVYPGVLSRSDQEFLLFPLLEGGINVVWHGQNLG